MTIDKKHIEKYLAEVKASVADNRYQIAFNDKRQDNKQLFIDYVIDEAYAKEILLSPTVMDFSEIRPNEHQG